MNEQPNMEDLFAKAKEIEKKKKNRNVFIISAITILTILYISYSTFKIKKTDDENVIIKQENKVYTDNISIEDSARTVIKKYFEFQNKGDSIGIFNLLNGTVKRYYLSDKLITKDSLYKSKKFEINRNGKYNIDTTFKISVVGDTIFALIKTPSVDKNNLTYDILHEMKLNKNYKVCYVRAYDLNSSKVKEQFGVK